MASLAEEFAHKQLQLEARALSLLCSTPVAVSCLVSTTDAIVSPHAGVELALHGNRPVVSCSSPLGWFQPKGTPVSPGRSPSRDTLSSPQVCVFTCVEVYHYERRRSAGTQQNRRLARSRPTSRSNRKPRR